MPTGALGFGFVDVTEERDAEEDGANPQLRQGADTYTITPTFRFANDQANGAVTVRPRRT